MGYGDEVYYRVIVDVCFIAAGQGVWANIGGFGVVI